MSNLEFLGGISCWNLTGKETKFLLFTDAERIRLIRRSLYFDVKCKYFCRASKRNIPKHLWAYTSIALQDHYESDLKKNNNKKNANNKNVQSNLNPGALQSPPPEVFEVEFPLVSVLLWQPRRDVAATLSAHCSADALEVSMTTRMASHDCEGQSAPINGTTLRETHEKKKMLLVTLN